MKYVILSLLLMTMIIGGCAQSGLSGIDYCTVYKPIMLPRDPLPRHFEVQIITQNELWERHCKPKKLWLQP